MRHVKYIAIHCSAGFGNLASVLAFWKSKGWKSPGYHYFIEEDGTIHRLLPLKDISNGVLGYNDVTINICYQGGVERGNVHKAKDTRTPAQKASIISCIKEVKAELAKTQDVNGIKIQGHRDFSPDKNGNGVIESWERIKECPSYDAIPEYKNL
ncbi:N-acetylmuramoyl-L-alanine amidase [compost metagenome]